MRNDDPTFYRRSSPSGMSHHGYALFALALALQCLQLPAYPTIDSLTSHWPAVDPLIPKVTKAWDRTHVNDPETESTLYDRGQEPNSRRRSSLDPKRAAPTTLRSNHNSTAGNITVGKRITFTFEGGAWGHRDRAKLISADQQCDTVEGGVGYSEETHMRPQQPPQRPHTKHGWMMLLISHIAN